MADQTMRTRSGGGFETPVSQRGASSSTRPPKRPRDCEKCENGISGSSITCMQCLKIYHGAVNCSGLSVKEFVESSKNNSYICNLCKNPPIVDIEIDETAVPDEVDLKAVFLEIRQFRSEVCDEIKKLREENSALRNENTQLKQYLQNIEKKVNALPTRTDQVPWNNSPRDSSAVRRENRPQNQNPGHRTLDNRQRSGSQNFRENRRRSNNNTRQDRPNHVRNPAPSNGRQYNQSHHHQRNARFESEPRSSQCRDNGNLVTEYVSDQIRNELIAALPLQGSTHCTKKVLVTLYQSGAKSVDIFNHLRRKEFQIAKVSRVETKYSHYRCFVIEVSDLQFNDLLHSNTVENNIWHPNTRVKEYFNALDPTKVIESTPAN